MRHKTTAICRLMLAAWTFFFSPELCYAQQPAKQPIFMNFFLHTMDPINTELSHPTILRIVKMYRQYVGKGDFYLVGSLVPTLDKTDAGRELKEEYRQAFHDGWGCAVLAERVNPQLRDAAAELDWEEGYQLVTKYKSKYQDIVTGEFDMGRDGNLAYFQKMFNTKPTIGIRHHLAQETYFWRQKGAILSLGAWPNDTLADSAPPPVAWHMGMLGVTTYKLDAIHTKTNQPSNAWVDSDDPIEVKKTILETIGRIPRDQVQLLYIGGHNVDCYGDQNKWNQMGLGLMNHVESFAYAKGNPVSFEAARLPAEFILPKEEQERRLRVREVNLKVMAEIAAGDPDIHVVFARDLLNYVKVEPLKPLSREQVVSAAKFVLENAKRGLPEYVKLAQDDYLTMAETYQALAYALTRWEQSKSLPQRVTVDKDVLGATRIPKCWDKQDQAIPSVDGKQAEISSIAKAARAAVTEIRTGDPVAIPAESTVSTGDSSLLLNAAEMLYAMASAVSMLGRDAPIVTLKKLTLVPDPCLGSRLKWQDDAEVKPNTKSYKFQLLQLWTIKPAVFIY